MSTKKYRTCGLVATVCGLVALLHAPSGADVPAAAPTAPAGQTMSITPPTFDSLKSSVTTAAERKAFLEKLHKEVIGDNLARPLNPKNEEYWESAFWGMELCQYRTETVLQSLRFALDTNAQRSDSFVRATMEAVYTLYPSELKKEVEKVARETKNPKNFAMAVHYLLRIQPQRNKEFYDLSLRKFPNQEHDPLLSQLRLNLEKSFSERLKSRPALVDLLKNNFPGNTPVIFSFQRQDRDYAGLAVVRKPDGSFLRRPDGGLFSIAQLARSLGNYASYLTNGSTPQGVFSVQGLGPSDNSFIGPTPTLQIVLPFEETVAHYFHNQSLGDKKWNKDLYENMLPKSWRNYAPIYEAYAAGEVGRGEIISHGTTIDPEFYKGEPYYPNTPSMGCLCAMELWSTKDGQCVYSDQLALVDAYSSLGSQSGYLVVVNLDNQPRPVDVYDVLPSILKAESSM